MIGTITLLIRGKLSSNRSKKTCSSSNLKMWNNSLYNSNNNYSKEEEKTMEDRGQELLILTTMIN